MTWVRFLQHMKFDVRVLIRCVLLSLCVCARVRVRARVSMYVYVWQHEGEPRPLLPSVIWY